MATVAKPPTLVVLQLTGGNDPLNTVIPYGDSLYWDNRPTVRIPEQEILRIDNRYGFHPSMAALKPFWNEGKMAIPAGMMRTPGCVSMRYESHCWFTAIDTPFTNAAPTRVARSPSTQSVAPRPRPTWRLSRLSCSMTAARAERTRGAFEHARPTLTL